MTTVLGNEQVTGDPEELFQGMKSLTGVVSEKDYRSAIETTNKENIFKKFYCKGDWEME